MMIADPWVVVFSSVGGSGLGIKETRISVTGAGCSVTGPTRIARAKSAVLAALALALHRVLVVLEGVADRHVPLTTSLRLLMLRLLLRLLLLLLMLLLMLPLLLLLLILLTGVPLLLLMELQELLLTLPLLEHFEIPSLRTAAVPPTISMLRL